MTASSSESDAFFGEPVFDRDLLLLLDLEADLDLAGDTEPDLDRDPLLDFTEPLPDLDLPGLGDPVLDFGDPDLDLADPEDPERDLDLDLLESDPESFALSPSRYLSFLLLPMSDI